MVGPYDLTISLGIAEDFQNPVFWNAIDRVVGACEKSGIAAGVQFASMPLLRDTQERGMRFLLYSNDIQVLFGGFKQAMSELKGG